MPWSGTVLCSTARQVMQSITERGLLMWRSIISSHWPLWFPRTRAILGTRNTRSPIPTFGLFMSLTLAGLLNSRTDPDYHNVSSSLQVWCSYLLLSIVLFTQQLAVCKVRPVRAPPRQYGLSYWPRRAARRVRLYRIIL